MTTPGLVSIVIPTYNDDPAHLREAVASALWQDGPVEVEVVLVDDGSTRQETVAAVDELGQSPGVRVLRQANAGAAAAMDAGVVEARGEYVITLGGDDYINDTFVSACVSQMAPGVAFVYSDLEYFYDDGTPSRYGHPPAEMTLASFMGGNRCAAVALVRREDWLRVGGLDAADMAFEDYGMWVRLLRSAPGLRAVSAPGAMLHYRQRPGSRRSMAPPAVRTQITREWLASPDDPVILRRMLLASWERLDEVGADLKRARQAIPRAGRLRRAVRRGRDLVRARPATP